MIDSVDGKNNVNDRLEILLVLWLTALEDGFD